MKHYEEGELLDKSACRQVRADLKKCMLESDCCRIKKKSPRECLLNPEGTVPDECFALRMSFFECKRSLIQNMLRSAREKGRGLQCRSAPFFQQPKSSELNIKKR